MNYTNEEIERTKKLCADDLASGKPRQIAIIAAVGMNRPGRTSHVSHERDYRDYLVKARRQLRDERSNGSALR